MARNRIIKHSIFKDEELALLPIPSRYFFIGLWGLADREGLLEDRPRVLKAEVYPWDDFNADEALDQLHPYFLVRYQVGGRRYLCIRNFTKHQRIHKREAPSVLPRPSKIDIGLTQGGPKASLVPDKATPGRPVLPTEIPTEVPSETPTDTARRPTGLPDEEFSKAFLTFWFHYPDCDRKGDRKGCWRVWEREELDQKLGKIILGLKRWKESRDWQKNDGEFIPAPKVWLNQERWNNPVKASGSGQDDYRRKTERLKAAGMI